MRQLDIFVSELKNIFGHRLKSIFVYGAKADISQNQLESDVNLIIITDSLTGDDLKNCSKPTLKWMGKGFFKKQNPQPVFMGENEWFNSSDVYAMEYADIKDNYKIIYGENYIDKTDVKKENLRLQCEAETKNLLMKFRSHYLLFANSKKSMESSIVPVIKNCMAIFKAVLRLHNIDVPKSKHEIINKIHEISDIDQNLFEKLLYQKEKQYKISQNEIYEISNKIVSELTKLLEYVNNI